MAFSGTLGDHKYDDGADWPSKLGCPLLSGRGVRVVYDVHDCGE